MSWATKAVEILRAGTVTTIKPRGDSMSGIIEDGDEVTLAPLSNRKTKVGMVVLCRVRGRDYLHLVKAKRGESCLIGNNKGSTNGWAQRDSIYGVVTHINGKSVKEK